MKTNKLAVSLKEQNRPSIWLIIAVNSIILWSISRANAIELTGMGAVLAAAATLLPVGLGVVIATVLNGLLSSDAKERLVFLRRDHVLPGHRAFSKYAKSDPRIDVAGLEKLLGSPLPSDPVEQNSAWYSKLYKVVENEPAVSQVHKDYLLLRDYTGLSVLVLIIYGAIGLFAIQSTKVWGVYFLLLITQFVLVRQAASQRGVRFVTTVLAQASARQVDAPAPEPSAKKKKKKN